MGSWVLAPCCSVRGCRDAGWSSGPEAGSGALGMALTPQPLVPHVHTPGGAWGPACRAARL